MRSPCCGDLVEQGWYWLDGDDTTPILVGVCASCRAIVIRQNPETLAEERVRDGDPASPKPRSVLR